MRGISWVAEYLLASHERLCCMESGTNQISHWPELCGVYSVVGNASIPCCCLWHIGRTTTSLQRVNTHTFSLTIFSSFFIVHRLKQMGSEGSGDVRSKIAAAATRPCCLDLDLDSLEADAALCGCKPAARMNRRDTGKLRIRKGNVGDTTSRRGPMVSAGFIPT